MVAFAMIQLLAGLGTINFRDVSGNTCAITINEGVLVSNCSFSSPESSRIAVLEAQVANLTALLGSRAPATAECRDGRTEACAAQSCKTILAAAPSSANGQYWVTGGLNPQQPMFAAKQVYCDMTRGGWTLVRVDDSPDKTSIRSVSAVGTLKTDAGLAGSCQSANAKLSDADIRSLWSEKLAYTTLVDSSGGMRYESSSDLNDVNCINGWTGRCGSAQQCTRWHFVADSRVVPGGPHANYCGWSASPCTSGSGYICWYGPHATTKNHLSGGSAHISIPSDVSAAGSEQGCGHGWVK